uniref:Uncharacterized protein n=1 Tax=Rhizophora mucronata TaxID=61149 RepID=A0A2P2R3E2_RHIMU
MKRNNCNEQGDD